MGGGDASRRRGERGAESPGRGPQNTSTKKIHWVSHGEQIVGEWGEERE